MTTDAFKDIEKLESDLWQAADNLCANSKLTSSDYFMPVLGVIFLRHAANRFEVAHRQVKVAILDSLWQSLPRPPFTEEDTETVADRVYDYLWQRIGALN
jgi:type I restriction enzyme M protein